MPSTILLLYLHAFDWEKGGEIKKESGVPSESERGRGKRVGTPRLAAVG